MKGGHFTSRAKFNIEKLRIRGVFAIIVGCYIGKQVI